MLAIPLRSLTTGEPNIITLTSHGRISFLDVDFDLSVGGDQRDFSLFFFSPEKSNTEPFYYLNLYGSDGDEHIRFLLSPHYTEDTELPDDFDAIYRKIPDFVFSQNCRIEVRDENERTTQDVVTLSGVLYF